MWVYMTKSISCDVEPLLLSYTKIPQHHSKSDAGVTILDLFLPLVDEYLNVLNTTYCALFSTR